MNKLLLLMLAIPLLFFFNNCNSGMKSTPEASSQVGSTNLSSTQTPNVISNETGLLPGTTITNDQGVVVTIGGGSGATVAGTGALSVPTADAVVARLENGLQKSVSSGSGNFAKALVQVQGNLPKVTDPMKATGYDQIQLLVYAACSDLTTGTTPLMQSKYNVNPNNTLAASKAALIAAGITMLDQHLAGLASQGPNSADVTTAFTTLYTQIAGVASNTTKIAFMATCIAANTAGTTMMGF